MTYQDVKQLVESLGLPYAYYQFERDTGQSPSFVCYFFTSSDDFEADNHNYQPIRTLHIELYTDQKDFALEAQLEARLDALDLPYYKEETYIKDQRLFMVSYEMEVYITNQKEE